MEELSISSPNSPLNSPAELKQQTDSKIQLHVYPLGTGEFLGKINVKKEIINEHCKSEPFETIIILDRSGSMGNWVELMVNTAIPNFLIKLGYKSKDTITLIVFDDKSELYSVPVSKLGSLKVSARGGTYMGPAVKALTDHLKSKMTKSIKAFRILTISDGDVFDGQNTKSLADLLIKEAENKARINSQAIRLFTSQFANPDTTALCSLLQLNNCSSVKLLDIPEGYRHQHNSALMTASICNLMADDGIGKVLTLRNSAQKDIFKAQSWDSVLTQSVYLKTGEDIIWMNSVSEDDEFFIGDLPVEIVMEKNLTSLDDASYILQNYIDSTVSQLKILKVVNSSDSTERIRSILNFFKTLESTLSVIDDGTDNLVGPSMGSRYAYLKKQLRARSRGFYMKLAQIANDNTIDKLNSAQKAEYLRSTAVSKTSRGLAKRAATSGLDFDTIARDEVRMMADHIKELENIDDSQHQVSFYSMESTLGGIRGVCNLVNEPNFEDLSVNEILLLLNIVGIACDGPIGDFPDPMTWYIYKIYPGCFVSVSDILTSKIQSSNPDSELSVPGQDDCTISNVIPVFEDHKIAVFLKKYAPNLLSYCCSVGMRRMIADVNMTDGYTMCGGIWKLMQILPQNPTELNLKSFEHLCRSFDLFAGGYFARMRDCLIVDSDDNEGDHLSFNLQNNGLTNMISPIYHCLSDESTCSKVKSNMAAILRALFTYETWQVIRRETKGDGSVEKIKTMLVTLLGIDLERDGVKMTPLFEPNLPFDESQYSNSTNKFNYEYLESFINNKGKFLKSVCVVPILLEAASNDTICNMKDSMPEFTDEFLKTQLGLPDDYDFKDYLMNTAIQSLFYPTKGDRVDSDKDEMLIKDPIWREDMREMIDQFVIKQFKGQYDADRVAKRKAEFSELKNRFIEALMSCTEKEGLIKLFAEGVTRGEMNYILKNYTTLGYTDIKNHLVDMSAKCVLRKDVISMFLTSIDLETGMPVYNEGKCSYVNNLDVFETVYLASGGTAAEWALILAEYAVRSVHSYRDSGLPNRHGHFCEKPSYWALGSPTLEEYRNVVTEEEFKEYCKIHFDCCGVDQLKL